MHNSAKTKRVWKWWWTLAIFAAVALLAGSVAVFTFRLAIGMVIVSGLLLLCPLLYLMGGHGHGAAALARISKMAANTIKKEEVRAIQFQISLRKGEPWDRKKGQTLLFVWGPTGACSLGAMHLWLRA